jgi:hypothetical protein
LKILTEFRFHWFANTWIMEPFIIHHKYYNNEHKCSRGIFASLYRSVVRSYLDIHVHIKVIGNKSSEYNVIYCVSNY